VVGEVGEDGDVDLTGNRRRERDCASVPRRLDFLGKACGRGLTSVSGCLAVRRSSASRQASEQ